MIDRLVIGCENLEVENVEVLYANLTLIASGNITLEDVLVWGDSKLTIEAEGDVIIVNNLEIKANAELDIKALGKVSINGNFIVDPAAKLSIINTF